MGMTIAEQYEWVKANFETLDDMNSDRLDLTNLPLQIDVSDIDVLPNEQYALLRKNGFGCSDSSKLLGVNPYGNLQDLIEEKSRKYLTDDEKAVGDKVAVRKGRELEPFIIQKNSQLTGQRIIKPVDMYRHLEFPFLTVNFDGVMECYDQHGQRHYIPNEIKVATYYGAKHYDKQKAFFIEGVGYFQEPDPEIATSNNSIRTKAAMYGVPEYYYTQLQMEMFHLNAPFGYLTVLFDNEWQICTWVVYKDSATQNQCVLAASKAWDKVAAAKHLSFDENGLIAGIGRTDGKAEAEKDKHLKNAEVVEGEEVPEE